MVSPSPIVEYIHPDGRPGCPPLLVALELHAQLVVVHAQVSVGTARYGIRPHGLHLLCDHADVRLGRAVVSKAVETKPVIEPAEPPIRA